MSHARGRKGQKEWEEERRARERGGVFVGTEAISVARRRDRERERQREREEERGGKEREKRERMILSPLFFFIYFPIFIYFIFFKKIPLFKDFNF